MRKSYAEEFLNDKEKEMLENWLNSITTYENTKRAYRTAIYIFFCSVRKFPENISTADLKTFFAICSDKITSGEWSVTYYRNISCALKSYIRFRYDSLKALTMLDVFPPSIYGISPKESSTPKTAMLEYLTSIADYDFALFTAVALAYGAGLSPQEIFAIRLSSLFYDENGRLGLSVGKGKQHRYIMLPASCAQILGHYISSYTLSPDTDIFSGSYINAKGKSVYTLNRHLSALQKNISIEGIEGKITIQGFRTISIGSMTHIVADTAYLMNYYSISRQYLWSLKKTYYLTNNPDEILADAYAACSKLPPVRNCPVITRREEKYFEYPL